MRKPTLFYRALCATMRLISSLFCNIKVTGRKNVIKGQTYIYLANHSSWADAILLYAFFPRYERIALLGEKNSGYQKKFILKLIAKAKINIVEVNRADEKARVSALRNAVTEVASGQSMLIFPEGRINQLDDNFYPFFRGSFFIAKRNSTPIMPVYIRGSERLYWRRNITIAFGEPIETNKKDDIDKLGTKVYYYMKTKLRPQKPKNEQKHKRLDVTDMFLADPLAIPDSGDQPLADGNSAMAHYKKVQDASKRKFNLE
jgi:1-acyl-sn-glycerol-3-phosphate acyltransferase